MKYLLATTLGLVLLISAGNYKKLVFIFTSLENSVGKPEIWFNFTYLNVVF